MIIISIFNTIYSFLQVFSYATRLENTFFFFGELSSRIHKNIFSSRLKEYSRIFSKLREYSFLKNFLVPLLLPTDALPVAGKDNRIITLYKENSYAIEYLNQRYFILIHNFYDSLQKKYRHFLKNSS